MADEKALQANQAQVANIIAQLQAQAGPRGATYAGRVLTPQDTPESIMARLPQGDTEEYGTMGLLAPGLGVGAGITKAELKAGVRPPVQIAAIARKGEIPTVAPHEMWPAAINVEKGEVAHAYKPGIGGHKPLMEAMEGAVRGFVDPNTWKAYTQEMLEALGNYWERAGGFFRAR